MKRFLIAVAIAAATVSTPALAADVGVSVSIGQPGFYGHIDIGDYPQPRVLYRQPIIVERVQVERPPVYLRVPPGHAKIGASIAANTTPAASAYSLCVTTGTNANMFRVIRKSIVSAGMMTAVMRAGMMTAVTRAGMVIMGRIRKTVRGMVTKAATKK